MKTFFSTLLLSSLLLAGSAAAVEVGDIYYSDKTFSSSVQSGKKAIGVVYWVSTNKDFGYIVALEEAPSTMNVFNANVHCLEYYTEGTLAGDWKLPQRIELVRLGKHRVNNATVDNYAKINAVLAKVTKANGSKATALGNKNYVANSTYPYAVNPYSGAIGGGGGNAQSSGTKYSVRCVTAF